MRNQQLFDAYDQETLNARQAAFDKHKGPRVGDVCYLSDGTVRRFTAAWQHGKKLQVTGTLGGVVQEGSYYFASDYLDYSGGLDSPIPADEFVEIGTTTAPAWLFHHNQAMANNGVGVMVKVREYIQLI